MSNSNTILYLGLDPSRFETKKKLCHCPIIKIVPKQISVIEPVKRATHLIFTSRSAVKVFFTLAREQDISLNLLQKKNVLSVGSATALLLTQHKMKPLIAKKETAEGVIELLSHLDLKNKHLFFPHSALSRPIIEGYLIEQKISHHAIAVYDTQFLEPHPWPKLEDFDEIVFTSPSTVEAFCHFFGPLPSQKKLTALGPITKKKMMSKKQSCPKVEAKKTLLSKDFSMVKKHTLPDLPYDYNALEPVISADIMQLHHQKHHNGYVNNLNAALEKFAEAEAKQDLDAQIALGAAIKFNGGGHLNHSIFWTNLAPKSQGGGEPPKGPLADAINQQFGSLQQLIDCFNGAAGPIQGSGWGWLGYCPHSKRLKIATCSNQDPLYATQKLFPLLGIDVWEHAYYLQYKNARPDYLKSIWGVVNWTNVASRFENVRA